MSNPTETLRAILEAIPHPGGLEALAELGTEMAELRSVMGAAAVELDAHWEAHCDAEGYGPVNLQRRLERGVAVEYPAFTAKGWAAQQACIAKLEALHRTYYNQPFAEVGKRAMEAEAHVHTLREALCYALAGFRVIYEDTRKKSEVSNTAAHNAHKIEAVLAATPAQALDDLKRDTLEEAVRRWEACPNPFIDHATAIRERLAILGPYACNHGWEPCIDTKRGQGEGCRKCDSWREAK